MDRVVVNGHVIHAAEQGNLTIPLPSLLHAIPTRHVVPDDVSLGCCARPLAMANNRKARAVVVVCVAVLHDALRGAPVQIEPATVLGASGSDAIRLATLYHD